MRSTLALGALFFLGACSSSSEERPCAESPSGAVFCREAEGHNVAIGTMSGSDAVLVTFGGTDSAPTRDVLDEATRALVPAWSDDDAIYDLGVFDGRFCFGALSSVRCGPLGGGDATTWLAGGPLDGTAKRITRVPGTARFVIERYNGMPRYSAEVVESTGGGTPSFRYADSRGAYWSQVVGDQLVVAIPLTDRSRSAELTAVPLAGGPARSLFTLPMYPPDPEGLGPLGRFFVVEGKVIAIGVDAIVRVDVATGAVESLTGTPRPESLAYRQVGATIVSITKKEIRVLDDQMVPIAVPILEAAAPDVLRADDVAVVGHALYVSIFRLACGTNGSDPALCDPSRGRWQIRRLDLP